MSAPKPLTHSVDIDLVGVTKLKSVTPEPSDQGVINSETTILRFRVQDGERITLDTGRRQFEVVVNPRAGAPYPGLGTADAPVVARDEAAELRAALTELVAFFEESIQPPRSIGSLPKRQRIWLLAARRILATSEGQS